VFVNPIPNESKANARLRRALSLAFTEDIQAGREYRYKQSIAINELLFGGAEPLPIFADGPQCDRAAATAYPAMQMRGSADNIAILPEFADTSLVLMSVRYVLVERVPDGTDSTYTSLTLAIGTPNPDHTIAWTSADGPEASRRSSIAFEGDRWVMRDGYDQIYFVRP
jgi:hypothetical protein